jgi:protocatechuate 3,4-dioxygenase, beta subunit
VFPRRQMLESLVASAATLSFAGPWKAAAAQLPPTPPQTSGPFYPIALPLDSDNDLIQIAGHDGTAKGTVTYITGRVLASTGRPISGARVEIWQCDANGRYHHVQDGRTDRPLDENFQGYGQATTDEAGGYRFRTIRPVPYPGRTPHIHFAVSGPGTGRLVTQMYIAGEPGNDRDSVLLGVRDPAARSRLIVPLGPALDGQIGALAATFDIVMGQSTG